MKKLIWLFLLIPMLSFAVIQFTLAPPVEREDGTALGLSEIAGFTVYCGTAIGTYTDSIYVAADTINLALPETVFEIPDLAIGTHYCVMTTVDIEGRESSYSENFVTVVHEGIYPPKPPVVAPNQTIRIRSTITQ